MIQIDPDSGVVQVEERGETRTYPMDSPEAFEIISRAWLRCGWDVKHVYSFTWLGRPIIQLPEDMVRLQEIIWSIKPDVILETGIAHGGSLVLSAGLCRLAGRGRVIGVDVEIRPHNRQAIEEHDLFDLITLIEGDSIEPAIVEQVRSLINEGETVIAFLDSCHTKEHVLGELNAYGPMVTPGSYIVAMDGIMEDLVGAPRTNDDWSWNNPKQAAHEFVRDNPDFVIEEPEWAFNEGSVRQRVTYWPDAFIKRIP